MKNTNTYELRDTFNDVRISRHRSLAASQAAMKKHLRAVRRHNGEQSYLTYEITIGGRLVDLMED